jgi:hypothetical protein
MANNIWRYYLGIGKTWVTYWLYIADDYATVECLWNCVPSYLFCHSMGRREASNPNNLPDALASARLYTVNPARGEIEVK